MLILITMNVVLSRTDPKNDLRNNGDLALWIDEKQVKMFSGKYSINQTNKDLFFFI